MSNSNPDHEDLLEAWNFVQQLRQHVRNLVLDETFAKRLGKAVDHYERTVERPNVGGASSDGDWDAE